MKIKIDKYGHLWLERAGVMRQQFCPYMPTAAGTCGDWCPLFGEPRGVSEPPDGHAPRYLLQICKTTYACDVPDFTDERGGK